MSCISAKCPLFYCCENARPKLNDSGVPYASYATGDSTGRNDYWCGPNGKFRLFKPIGTQQTIHTTTEEPTVDTQAVSLFRAYKGQKVFYLLFNTHTTLEQLINSSEKFVLGSISDKGCECTESNARKVFHIEDFNCGAVNLRSFDFIEYVSGEIVFLKGFTSEPYMVISPSVPPN